MKTMAIANIHKRKKTSKLSSMKYVLIAFILLFFVPLLYLEQHYNINNKISSSNSAEGIYDSMTKKDNRLKAYNRAIALNNGSSANSCVYFLSEVLRMNDEEISDNVCNTTQILDIMKNEGFKKERDYKKLKRGDVVFTTDAGLNPYGVPTHTYIFMGWKEDGLYDYAYICDNQANDYDGNIYHLRNITKLDSKDGNAKEPFGFFMYK
jgi:hypothetical protein